MSSSPRSIGLLATTSLVTGNMIGSGVFLLPASLSVFGMLSLLGWGITTVGALCLALVFAHLSKGKDASQGGPHQSIRKAFGKEAGFFAAWGYWVLSWISNAALVVAATGYLSEIYGGFSVSQSLMVELGIIFVVTSINMLGIVAAGRFELMMTLLKLIPLIGIPLFGLFYINPEHLSLSSLHAQSFANLKAVIFLTLWGFIGVETATVPAAEVRNPKTTVPLATILGTLIAAIVYMMGTFVLLGVLSSDQLAQSNAPYAQLAQAIFGGQWGIAIAGCALLCCIGSFNGWTLVVSRIASGAAKEGLFPKFFARENRFGAPYISLLVSSALTIPLLLMSMQSSLLDQFNMIIDFSITLILFIYLGCTLAYLKEQALSKLTVGTILIGGCTLAFILFALWAAGMGTVLLSLTILLTGVPVHLLIKRAQKLPRIASQYNPG